MLTTSVINSGEGGMIPASYSRESDSGQSCLERPILAERALNVRILGEILLEGAPLPFNPTHGGRLA